MEENKQMSFYEFLSAHSTLNNTSTTGNKVKPFYLFLAWLVIFFSNTIVLWLTWNYIVSTEFGLPSLTFLKSAALYGATKTLFRGFFSVQ